MYVERKKIHGKEYYYLKRSVREGSKVRSKTVAYLGKSPLSRKQLQHRMAMVRETVSEYGLKLLSSEQQSHLEQLRQEFALKLRQLDTKTIQDMFRDFSTYYIYNTNAIEGNSLTLEETSLLLNESRTPAGKDLREIYDHLNEQETFSHLLQHKPDITIKTILDIQARLLRNIDERRGYFRRHNVRVVGADFQTSPAEYVLTDMKILLKWYGLNQKRMHPLVLAALFHEKFERIHPFYDGNGRTGRMLLNLILLRKGFPPLIIRNDRRQDYYRALSQGHKAGLTSADEVTYVGMVNFCYGQMVQAWENIFSKWGQ